MLECEERSDTKSDTVKMFRYSEEPKSHWMLSLGNLQTFLGGLLFFFAHGLIVPDESA